MPVKRLIQSLLRPFGYQLVQSQRVAARPGAGPHPTPPPELGLHRTLRGLVARGFRPAAVAEVGAAHGQWTRTALLFWPQARYFLIEPQSDYQPALAALSQARPNVQYLIAEAGRAPGVTLDGLLAGGQMAAPQFIKIGGQRNALIVLEGATAALAQCVGLMVALNFHRAAPGEPLLHEVLAWLVARGFWPYEVVDVSRRPRDGAMSQCDLLFVREGHRLLSEREVE